MMHTYTKVPKPHSAPARALANRLFHQLLVLDKKKFPKRTQFLDA